jgi:uncharacterized caspase-like protein
VQIVYPVNGLEIVGRDLSLTLENFAPSLSYSIYLNGQLAEVLDIRNIGLQAQGAQTQSVAQIRVKIPEGIIPGSLTITVSARTSSGIFSEPRSVIVLWKSEVLAQQTGRLFVLSVGVNQYQTEKAQSLRFATKDAQDLSKAFEALGKSNYKEVKVTLLTDAQATNRRVLEELSWLRRNARPEDTVVVSFSSHGINIGDDYYVILNDSDPNFPESTALKQRDLTDFWERTNARVVVLLDTCHAGALVGARDPSQSSTDRLVGNLARGIPDKAQDRFIFTAATGSQYAEEDPRWGNGAFTKAILEALQGEADRNGDGQIQITELDEFVSSRVKELTQNRQSPSARKQGNNFVLIRWK